MIRINLLTRRKRARRAPQGGQAWLALVLVMTLLEVAALFVFHGVKSEELEDQERKNRELSTQIQQSKKASSKHTEVKDKLDLLRAREDSIQKLQSARTGPTAVLLELARLLTLGRGPSVDPERLGKLQRDNPLASYNPNWDSRRLWLLGYREEKRRMRIDGIARDGEDVSELARRMNLSDYFASVRLLPAHRDTDSATKLPVVRFSMEAEVKY